MRLEESEAARLGGFVVDSDNGWMMAHGKRIITFRVETYQAMMDKLTGIAGSTVAKTLFYQMGEQVGQEAMRYSRHEVQSTSDLALVADKVLRFHGWGRCSRMEKTVQEGKMVYVCVLKGTPLSYQRTASEPTCHMMRGIAAGWLEAYFERKAQSSTETACASMGKQDCTFEVEFDQET